MRKNKKLVIFGNEKMAQLANFYFTKDSDYEICAFTVDKAYLTNSTYENLPVVAFEDVEEKYPPSEYYMFVAVGYKKLNMLREKKYNEAKTKGYKLASYVSSKLTSWGDTQIGDNCFIFENQVFQPFVKIGNNVVVWSGNHFGHDVEVGDHTFIASHVVLSGYVKVGCNCFIGINSSIRDQVVIGNECLVGSGSLLNNNIKDKSVYIEQATPMYPMDSEMFEKMMEISK